ncbi:hypothetical protein BGX27_009769 [Mortierella sp. AM989]|nr:hypothetical protein BGX27_009769 [Mortierella sp. AM989]
MVDCLPRLKVLRLNCCYGQVLAWLRPLMGLEFLQELAFINDADNHLDDDTQSGPSALVLVHGGSDEGLEGSSDTSDTIGPEDENADVEYELMPVHDAMNSDNEDEAILKPDHLGDFLAARASTLKRLRFEGSDLIGFRLFETFNNTRSSAEPVANSVPVLALKYLNLSNTTINHPRSVVEPLLRQCPGLEILDISRNFDPPWNKFQWSILHQYCLKLTSLNLGGITFIDNDQLIQVVHLCPGLSSLIAFQSNLLNSVLDAIVDVRVEGSSFVVDGSAQQPASFLELDVSWCTGITQDAIERVLQHLPTLKSIKFSWCQHVNLSVFRRHWSCIGLEELEAQGLEKPAIGDQAKNTAEYIMFERICRFQSLRRLVIGSDDVNVSVANGFDQLRGNRGGVDDQKQRHLARLEYLELVGNEECPMGVAELAVIADILPRLCRFHFGLGLVTPEMQAWLSSKRPDIQQDEQRIYF